jgi:alpha-ketoglutarate-dependent taurine dioxygenase
LNSSIDLRDVLRPYRSQLAALAHLPASGRTSEDDQLDAARELLGECAEFRAVGAQLAAAMKSAAGWTVLTGFPATEYGKEGRDILLLGLGLALGTPTRTDCTVGRRIWEVTPRRWLPAGHVPTITECAAAAELHTDSQYRSTPERYVALLVIRPAGDGGGETTILTANQLVERLTATPQGRDAHDVLRSAPFPFAVPTSFLADPRTRAAEFIQAPILAAEPMIRYRSDTLAAGFELAPSLATQEALAATMRLGEAIANHPATVQFHLQTGDVLFVDNHRVLHGRTDFADPRRLLLRLRISAAD